MRRYETEAGERWTGFEHRHGDIVIELVPDGLGILRDPAAFFRSGRSGDGGRLLTEDQLARYHHRLAALAPADVATWLDR